MTSPLEQAARSLGDGRFWWELDQQDLDMLSAAVTEEPGRLAMLLIEVFAGEQVDDGNLQWLIEDHDSDGRLLEAMASLDSYRTAQFGLSHSSVLTATRPQLAAKMIASYFDTEPWMVPDALCDIDLTEESTWRWAAELLDPSAPGADKAVAWLLAKFEVTPWFRHDPKSQVRDPEALRVAKFERSAAAIDELFPPDGELRRSATAAVEWLDTIAREWVSQGRDPMGWLSRIEMPGCGHQMCCRVGLFEWELLQRGYQLRGNPPRVPFEATST